MSPEPPLANVQPALDALLWQMPYGRGLWNAVAESPWRWIQRLNHVAQMWTWRCDGDFVVYVETALPALGELVLFIVDVDWDDIARAYFRPKNVRSRWFFGRKKVKRTTRKRFEIPEIGEVVGKRLPWRAKVAARRIGNFQRFLWIADGFLQRALLYYGLAELVTNVGYTWTTGLYRDIRCSSGNAGGMVLTWDGGGTPSNTNAWRRIPVGPPIVGYGPFEYLGPGRILAPAGSEMILVSGIRRILVPGPFGFRLRLRVEDGPVLNQSMFIDHLETGDNSAAVSARLPYDAVVVAEYMTSGTGGTAALVNPFWGISLNL